MLGSKGWTEIEIQLALFGWLERRKRLRIIPNVYPTIHWHECDMFSLTKAGYFHEIEVKVTRSDFQSDFKKTSKHDALSGKCLYGRWHQRYAPRSFCYACPEGLLAVDDMPHYAGLLWIERHEPTWKGDWLDYDVQIVKKPPALSGSQKMTAEQVLDLDRNMWYRFARTWRQMAKLKVEIAKKKDHDKSKGRL